MAQKEFTVHDGEKFIKITGEEILDQNNLPSGHFKEIKREKFNVLGILDDENIKQQFIKDLVNKVSQRNYNYLIIGPNILFSINRYINDENPDLQKTNFSDCILEIVQKMGYLLSYTIEESPMVKMTLEITSRTNLNNTFFVDLIPYDTLAYGFNYYN